jgi:hydrogenase maturation protein HypF
MTGRQQLTEQILAGFSIRVRGTVQGVGFRPTVFKLAAEYGIKGHVLNDSEGVLIEAWGSDAQLSKFVRAIRDNPPPLARIEKISQQPLASSTAPDSFFIMPSANGSAGTDISSDAATCEACVKEVFNPSNRRFRYPFINCTHCGPRLSIIQSIPYDRPYTSMSKFTMCVDCQSEYDDPGDLRFHAQPNACHACGPKAWLEGSDGRTVFAESLTQLDHVDAACTLIQRGEILAIKGIGGFHLACDATNEEAVAKLRARKERYHKPFALMARDMNMIKDYGLVDELEASLLQSNAAPIVVLNRKPDGQMPNLIAPSVAPCQHTLGFMLPYTALHHLLLERMDKPIVLTSGNRVHEPQCTDNAEARIRLGSIADYLLMHDRDIVNRLDDSVARVSCGQRSYLRRARGLAPKPIPLPKGFEDAPDILATGAELKNTFCLTQNSKAIISQHIGDLEDARTYADYQNNLALYTKSFQHRPARIAVDLHPEYLSGKLGRALALEKNLPLDEVQHHHAHIASCLTDNLWPLDAGPVLGVALDGLGYGCDGTFWGGEFMLADYTSFERLGTFKPVALIGGSQAMREPWRNAYAHLMAEMGWPKFKADFEELELLKFFESKPLATYNSMLAYGVNSPLASSCGRLFDAVASMLGICRDNVTYEGQAACELEAIACRETLEYEAEDLGYPFAVLRLGGEGLLYIEPLAAWQSVLSDLLLNTSKGVMAARFHKGLAKAIVQMVEKLCTRNDEKWLCTVALSGGVFQNKILQELVYERLSEYGYTVLIHQNVPANDGGISLGQAVVSAASQIRTNKERSHVSWHTWSNS